jgi:archaellum component FlaG (FlaF/FlaG flagellin family)
MSIINNINDSLQDIFKEVKDKVSNKSGIDFNIINNPNNINNNKEVIV